MVNWSAADKAELKKFEKKAVSDQDAVIKLEIGDIDMTTVFNCVRNAASVKVTTEMVEQRAEFNAIKSSKANFGELLKFKGVRLPGWMKRDDFLTRNVEEFLETECTMDQGNRDEVLSVTKQLAQAQHKAKHQLKAADLIGESTEESKWS